MRRLALITGASSGIGLTFAKELATRGYDLVLVARREDRLKQVADSLRQAHAIATEVLPADLTSDEGLARVEQRVIGAENLELLVNNAGFGILGYFHRVDASGQGQMHRLHVLATVRLTHAALGGMIARGRGGVINVSSVAGFWQAPASVSYDATKCWMNSFTRGLALELKSIGSPVQVQALCPGFTISEFHEAAGIDRNLIPKSWWMTAEQVVEESLRGFDQGKVFVIPGWRYRLLVFCMKHLPQAMIDAVALQQRKKLPQHERP
jgi:short-subunit dehydrogenase